MHILQRSPNCATLFWQLTCAFPPTIVSPPCGQKLYKKLGTYVVVGTVEMHVGGIMQDVAKLEVNGTSREEAAVRSVYKAKLSVERGGQREDIADW
ncbi:hypothetical protein GGS23DRAFT_207618 [Durotheca rogersii]|uniref:uncharacterized protein n=1 Tax=Durotheca rogersii TaxID=419775 RepID=UPI0022208878|nr:uncharacterized protein GGS23DRAFT_207618 [Durotheca rogersii]KAI5861074.1 hypothetical protein GGS23DRAFT_207618 [Durotheca rogersii]